jgi:4'-phosphopantetheinyl transferase
MIRTEILGFNEDPNKLFIYVVNIADNESNITLFWGYLSTKEKKQVKKYSLKTLSNKYIITHGILRYILSQHSGLPPQDIEFTYNKEGKPFLKKSNIQFNMSHSHDIVSYAVALNCRLGIDVEFKDNNLNIEDLPDFVFNQEERKFFSILDPNAKFEFFYNLWTKKESIIKAIGFGLAYPLNNIDIIPFLSNDKVVFNYKKKNYIAIPWKCQKVMLELLLLIENYGSKIMS